MRHGRGAVRAGHAGSGVDRARRVSRGCSDSSVAEGSPRRPGSRLCSKEQRSPQLEPSRCAAPTRAYRQRVQWWPAASLDPFRSGVGLMLSVRGECSLLVRAAVDGSSPAGPSGLRALIEKQRSQVGACCSSLAGASHAAIDTLACPREGHARAIAWIRTDDPWEMISEEGSRPRADCSPTRPTTCGMRGG
jgi:hypothetical protein